MYAPGDEVFGMPLFPKPASAYAEYVVAPPRHFARKPAGLDHVSAAGLPLAGLTAWQSLVDVANIQPGQRVWSTPRRSASDISRCRSRRPEART
jgi:NADPH:quinone reductase-like Zn-dependent oxidoreductase